MLWEVSIHCVHIIEARRPDIIVIRKREKECMNIDITAAGDKRYMKNRRKL